MDGVERVVEVRRGSHVDVLDLVMNVLDVHASVMVVSYLASHMHYVVRSLGRRLTYRWDC